MPEAYPQPPQREQAQNALEPIDSVEREVRKSIPNLNLFEQDDSNRPSQIITVSIRPNGNLERDKRRLKNIHGVLIAFPGKDKFSFQIFEGYRGHLIDFLNYNTRVCPEMLARLKKVLGNEEWRIEDIEG